MTSYINHNKSGCEREGGVGENSISVGRIIWIKHVRLCLIRMCDHGARVSEAMKEKTIIGTERTGIEKSVIRGRRFLTFNGTSPRRVRPPRRSPATKCLFREGEAPIEPVIVKINK